jgi:NADH-ubiquinone oxidoreductase chain 5
MRKIGSMVIWLPVTYSMILLGSLSLMAFPFLTGFYSKDLLLEIAMVPHNATTAIAYLLALLAALLTATYSARLMILTFLSRPHWHLTLIPFLADPSGVMVVPLLLLALGAAYFGFLTSELFLGLGSGYYQGALWTHPDHLLLLNTMISGLSMVKLLPLATLLILFSLWPSPRPQTAAIEPHRLSLYTTFLMHFNTYNHWIIYRVYQFAATVSRYWDRGFLEVVGPTGLVKLFHYYSFKLELLSTGLIPHYAFLIVFLPFTILVLLLLGR